MSQIALVSQAARCNSPDASHTKVHHLWHSPFKTKGEVGCEALSSDVIVFELPLQHLDYHVASYLLR